MRFRHTRTHDEDLQGFELPLLAWGRRDGKLVEGSGGYLQLEIIEQLEDQGAKKKHSRKIRFLWRSMFGDVR